ncbi:MAG TPA: hypothetical protein PK018_00875 [Candidatus Competibacter sp.]|nr:hypothetical protein [Candidatus Competibacter sp.]HRW64128.1 hypothetical protein [Candidatus Competibacter sp.]
MVLTVGVLSGCAAPPAAMSERVETTTAPANEAESWWYLRFRLTWPEGEEPLWWPDLLLADRVIGPVLDAERNTILLWRFHRRAARDGAGRQFSFIFRATPLTAARVNARIAADPLVIRLREEGVIQTVGYDDPGHPQRLGIGDTSDKNWSPEMQVAWPYFIMGVSQLWLELIREIGKNQRWSKEPLARYAAIERALDAMWRDEGGHALLHHLSAVFGYRELTVTRQELMRF